MIRLRPLVGAFFMMLTSGCDDSRRVTEMAREAADRQAAQNVELARVAAEAAGGAGRLVAADAEARRDSVRLSADIQKERTRLDQGWTKLTAERKDLDGERRRAASMAVMLKGLGVVVVAALAMALAWLVLVRDSHDLADSQAALDFVATTALEATSIHDIDHLPPSTPTQTVGHDRSVAALIDDRRAEVPRDARRLSHEELVMIVAAVQAILYRDVDDAGTPYWNPDKEWRGGDMLDEIASVLDEHRLGPP